MYTYYYVDRALFPSAKLLIATPTNLRKVPPTVRKPTTIASYMRQAEMRVHQETWVLRVFRRIEFQRLPVFVAPR